MSITRNSTTQHAVLASDTLLWIEGKGFQSASLPTDYTLHDLTQLAMQHQIARVWLLHDLDFPQVQGETKSTDYRFSRYERHHKLAVIYVRRTGHKEPCMEIIFSEHTAWNIADVAPHDLLIALLYMEQALGVSIGMSPGRAGWNYLKKMHPQWVQDAPKVDLKANHFITSAGPDIIWQRTLQPSEKKKRYLHKFDKSAAYPYAATQTDIGVGTPHYVEHGRDMDDFQTSKGTMRQSQAVGVWRCTVTKKPDRVDATMPPVWENSEGWLAGPVIRLLRTNGYEVEVHEGYVFQEHHDVLVKWSNDLWRIRQDFAVEGKWKSRSGAKVAEKLTKRMMNAMLGLAYSQKLDDDDEMKRPDIRVQVIARHRELTYHNINKIRELCSITPLLVYMDAIYYLSDEPDGRKALPELVKREFESDGHTLKFGGYKWEGCIDVTETFSYTFDSRENALSPFSGKLLDLFTSALQAKYNEGNVLEILNAKGWTR